MMHKLRRLFMSSFRWRLLINISLSYLITFLVYSAILIILQSFNIFSMPEEIKYLLSFIVSFLVFLTVFSDLMNITLRYITDLNHHIQEVTMGDYDVHCEIEYDDELGILAANINALAKTLKEKEEEGIRLKENERLAYRAERNAEQAKKDMITNIAHDLRTPLTTIMGYLELIKDNPALGQEEINNYSTIAYDKSLRLQYMMDDLFEYTKLDNTELKLNLAQINISELILQLTDEFYPSFQEHHVYPVINIEKPNLYILGDGQLLARVFENLISNALKYGIDHHHLTIEVLSNNKHIEVRVRNHGMIAEEDIPYIFDKFYRSDTSRSSSTGGTGLGLAIAKNVIDLHNGSIYVKCENKQTTFVVELNQIDTGA